jgi:steroid delta-isomerase-like uncharacterized protein
VAEKENIKLAREFFKAIDEGKLDRVRELCSAGFALHVPGSAKPWAVDDVLRNIREFYAAFPDSTHAIQDVIAEGDKVVIRLVQDGTHRAAFKGVSATGKMTNVAAVHILRFEKGKVKEFWALEDTLGQMTQLGMELRTAHQEAGGGDAEAKRAEDELRAADAAWARAAETKDLEAYVSFYDSDALVLMPDIPPAAGRDARSLLAPVFASPTYQVTWKLSRVEVARSGELGYTSGRYEQTFTGTDGARMREQGKYTSVWRRQGDGTWKSAVDTFNRDGPATPALP